MQIRFNVQKLQTVLDDFHNITGIRICIMDTDFNMIADTNNNPQPFCSLIQSYDNCQGCIKSDDALLKQCEVQKGASFHVCHAGLIDIALPITINGLTIGYAFMGQIRESKDYNSIRHMFPPHANHDMLKQSYSKLVYYNRTQIESLTRTAVMLAISVLAEDMIKLEADELSEKAAQYIKTNLCNDLSLKTLCTIFNTSKNLLYKSFDLKFGCTINEYIINCRIDFAKELLLTSQLSIREIGEKAGIQEETYFCRLFKHKVGCTPLQYRKKACP